MILRKPYAFFIKMFKPIHILLGLVIAYLIYLDNNILTFLNKYIYSTSAIKTDGISNSLISPLLYIIPLIVIIFSLLILGVMFNKKKPIRFYIVNIFSFIVVLIINIYISNFIKQIEVVTVSIRTAKLLHDITLISIMIQSVAFVFFIVRGMGVNFKKFNFDSEILKLDISESDKEEIEIALNLDLDESKRKRNKRWRYLKYSYAENKFLVNIVAGVFLTIVVIIVLFIINISNKVNVEGQVYEASTFSFGVDETLILTTDYRGRKLTDDYLVVVNTRMQSPLSSNSLYNKDFSLKIGEFIFKPTTKYSSDLVDIGTTYNESILLPEFNNYLFVYEVAEKYIESEMFLRYSDKGNNIDIKLNPVEVEERQFTIKKNMKEEISFENSLGDIKFKINNYDIKDKFTIEYNYCFRDDDCMKSIEYLKASFDKNYDKYLLKLSVEFEDNSDLRIKKFYDFFSRFGAIEYTIGSNGYYQRGGFEEVNSKKLKDGYVYIGVNSDIAKADSIKLIFNIRGSNYEYILK